jgi:hypothetical protein
VEALVGGSPGLVCLLELLSRHLGGAILGREEHFHVLPDDL